jgi:hypothetical protein
MQSVFWAAYVHCHLEYQALSQTACDVTRKAKRQSLFTFSERIKYHTNTVF